MKEQWRPVPDHEGYYEVSDLGNVRSLPRTVPCKGIMGKRTLKGKPMKLRPSQTGYPYVIVCKNATYTRWFIHQLVLAVFVGPRPHGMNVRHLNGDPSDSRLVNLVYGTQSQNMLDKRTHGTDHQVNKTHCPYGHPYAGENLYVDPRGGRYCRTCKALSRMGPYADKSKRVRTSWVAASIVTAMILPGLIFGAPTAKAQPLIPDTVVCSVLADYPSMAGLKGVLQGVADQGYTAYESGRIVAAAVYTSCPTFIPLLDQFVAIYAPQGQIA